MIESTIEYMAVIPGIPASCDIRATLHIAQASSKKEQRHLKEHAFLGNDIVDSVVRLCAMNLYLHGIGGDECPITASDALAKEVGDDKVDMVLANPPFGKKSSITVINEKSGKKEQEKLVYEREDFWATTSNKQLNFVQHIANMLKIDGKAAVVVPDNVLFEGGAGETVRKNLLERCDLHTLLRLPTGIFYAQGVKANVLFFDKKPGREGAWTEKLWIYDLRTNMHFTLKTDQMGYADLEDFIKCYNPENLHQRQESERFRAFTYAEIMQRDKVSLDIFWLKDESLEDTENLPDPDVLAEEIVESLQSALAQFAAERFATFVEGYGAALIGERTLPFLLMIVGFFPISISLVIASMKWTSSKPDWRRCPVR